MIDTFLQINDQINTVLNRYEAFRKGDFVTSSNPIPAELAGSSSNNDLSLIDLDEGGSPKVAPGTSVQDELASLFGPPSAGTTLAAPIPSTTLAAPIPTTGFAMSSMMQPPQVGSIMLPGTPQPTVAQQSRKDPFADLAGLF
jgi:ADP-ribosylation factor-binding protein GGA